MFYWHNCQASSQKWLGGGVNTLCRTYWRGWRPFVGMILEQNKIKDYMVSSGGFRKKMNIKTRSSRDHHFEATKSRH